MQFGDSVVFSDTVDVSEALVSIPCRPAEVDRGLGSFCTVMVLFALRECSLVGAAFGVRYDDVERACPTPSAAEPSGEDLGRLVRPWLLFEP